MNPIDFRGQRSKVKVTMEIYGNKLVKARGCYALRCYIFTSFRFYTFFRLILSWRLTSPKQKAWGKFWRTWCTFWSTWWRKFLYLAKNYLNIIVRPSNQLAITSESFACQVYLQNKHLKYKGILSLFITGDTPTHGSQITRFAFITYWLWVLHSFMAVTTQKYLQRFVISVI